VTLPAVLSSAGYHGDNEQTALGSATLAHDGFVWRMSKTGARPC